MSKGLELARCVEINLQNLLAVMPILKSHPYTEILRLQIKDCITELENEEAEVINKPPGERKWCRGCSLIPERTEDGRNKSG